MKRSEKQNINTRKRKRNFQTAVAALSIIVAGTVAYNLMLPSYTLSKSEYCGESYHVHDETCMTKVLTCGLDESDTTENTSNSISNTASESENGQATGSELICGSVEHIHDDSCFDEWGNLICDQEEHTHDESCYSSAAAGAAADTTASSGHVHTDECYSVEYTCGHEEHKHTLSCFSNPEADIEEEDDWKDSFKKAKLSDEDVKANILAVANTQIGYKESTSNYEVVDEASETIRGITRYGQWYGKSYADWDAMFASFCIYYADAEFPLNYDTEKWFTAIQNIDLYHSAGSYTPVAGDLIFFEREVDDKDPNDSDVENDGKKLTVGIVSEVNEKKENIKVIEGDYENQVKENKYDLSDETILGYGVIPSEERDADAEAELPGSDEVDDSDSENTISDESQFYGEEETNTDSADTSVESDPTQSTDPEAEETEVTDAFGEDENADGESFDETNDADNPEDLTASDEDTGFDEDAEFGEETESGSEVLDGVVLKAVDQNGNDFGEEFWIQVDHEIILSNLSAEGSDIYGSETVISQTINTTKEVELTGAKYETSYVYTGAFYGGEEVYAVGDGWIDLAEGTLQMPYGAEVQLVYQEDRTQTVYTYEDEDIQVTATTSTADTFPDDAIFKVTPVTPESTGYNYEAYYNAAINAGASENMLLYDFAFYRPQADTWLSATEEEAMQNLVEIDPENLPLTELQPENGGTVTFELLFKNNQLEELGIDSELNMIHLPINSDVARYYSTTVNTIGISEEDIVAEFTSSEFEENKVIFTASELSVYSASTSTSLSWPLIVYKTVDDGKPADTDTFTFVAEKWNAGTSSWIEVAKTLSTKTDRSADDYNIYHFPIIPSNVKTTYIYRIYELPNDGFDRNPEYKYVSITYTKKVDENTTGGVTATLYNEFSNGTVSDKATTQVLKFGNSSKSKSSEETQAATIDINKRIDALRDGDENDDTTLDNSSGEDQTDNYRLYLDLKAKLPESAGYDLLIVLDISSSMQNNTVSGTSDENGKKLTRLQVMKNVIEELIPNFLQLNSKNRVAIVTFCGSGKYIAVSQDGDTLVDWTSNSSIATTAVTNVTFKTGTNYEAGLCEAQTVLNNRGETENTPYMLFMSDGNPYTYVNSNYGRSTGSNNATPSAKVAIQSFLDANPDLAIRTVGFSSDVSSGTVLKILGRNGYVQATSQEDLTKAFDITQVDVSDVTITDQLSAYVDLHEQPDYKVTMKNEDPQEGESSDEIDLYVNGALTSAGRNVLDNSNPITFDASTKTVTLKFKDGYEASSGYRYTLSFNIKVNDYAYEQYAANGYAKNEKGTTITGETNTDYTGNSNNTSSGFEGFRSNYEAKVSYKSFETETVAYYKHPVVQVGKCDIELTKVSSENTDTKLAKASFDLYRADSTADSFVLNTNNTVKGIKVNDEEIVTGSDGTVVIKDLMPGTYYLVEKTSPDGYSLLTDPIKFTIVRSVTADDQGNTHIVGSVVKNSDTDYWMIKVSNDPGMKLPETGGSGSKTFLIIGTAVLLGAVTVFMLYEQKRRRA